jgi:hypothetical protein
MEPVTLRTVEKDMVHYSVNWSAMEKVDKYQIINSVPAMAGIFELYFMDEKKKLNLFYFALAWYGGLRHTLRQITDPDLNLTAPDRRKVLEDRECYYRYSLVSSHDDLTDILHYLAAHKLSAAQAPPSSGRFAEIFLDEDSPDKIITL